MAQYQSKVQLCEIEEITLENKNTLLRKWPDYLTDQNGAVCLTGLPIPVREGMFLKFQNNMLTQISEADKNDNWELIP